MVVLLAKLEQNLFFSFNIGPYGNFSHIYMEAELKRIANQEKKYTHVMETDTSRTATLIYDHISECAYRHLSG